MANMIYMLNTIFHIRTTNMTNITKFIVVIFIINRIFAKNMINVTFDIDIIFGIYMINMIKPTSV